MSPTQEVRQRDGAAVLACLNSREDRGVFDICASGFLTMHAETAASVPNILIPSGIGDPCDPTLGWSGTTANVDTSSAH